MSSYLKQITCPPNATGNGAISAKASFSPITRLWVYALWEVLTTLAEVESTISCTIEEPNQTNRISGAGARSASRSVTAEIVTRDLVPRVVSTTTPVAATILSLPFLSTDSNRTGAGAIGARCSYTRRASSVRPVTITILRTVGVIGLTSTQPGDQDKITGAVATSLRSSLMTVMQAKARAQCREPISMMEAGTIRCTPDLAQ
jgi:hypothetical protein